jgi:hypothetical protein
MTKSRGSGGEFGSCFIIDAGGPPPPSVSMMALSDVGGAGVGRVSCHRPRNAYFKADIATGGTGLEVVGGGAGMVSDLWRLCCC